MENGSMPVGLMMALAQRPEAMLRFARMDEQARRQILARAHSASSKEEMQRIVEGL